MISRFSHAFRGLATALRRQEILVHGGIALGVTALGVVTCLDRTSWALVVLAITVVLVAEIINSALEELADVHVPVPLPSIRRAKDFSAATVLVAAIGAVAIGALIFLPPWLSGQAGSCLLLS